MIVDGAGPDPSKAQVTHLHSGKVRDLYRMSDGHILMVASDRMSAFDFILPDPIPDKGRILTAMTVWWFSQLAGVVDNHLVSYDDELIPDQWRGRAMICESLDMIGVEAVARGYLAGGGYAEYLTNGSVCGVGLPAGLQDGDRLPEPIFTPAGKAAVGEHDENISFSAVQDQIGAERADQLRTATLELYSRASEIARERGIILADTKFEFGVRPGGDTLVLGDEVLTPDSSRFWPAESWQPGRSQPSFDKQYVRDWLISPASGWDRSSDAPPPSLPEDVAQATRQRYIEAYETLTGLRFADWLAPAAAP